LILKDEVGLIEDDFAQGRSHVGALAVYDWDMVVLEIKS
jgi:hypothetical protein